MWPGMTDSSFAQTGGLRGPAPASPMPPHGGFGSHLHAHRGMQFAGRQTTSSPPPAGPAAEDNSRE
jgi:hypothetical protein